MIDEIVDDIQSVNFQDDEKSIRDFIKKNNDGLTHHFKKNIVNLYLHVDAGEKVYISPFHILFFAQYFPYQIDFNMDGNLLLKTNEFTVDNIVQKLEDPYNKFSFEQFFFYVVNTINKEVVTINQFMKIKEIFGGRISKISDVEISQTFFHSFHF